MSKIIYYNGHITPLDPTCPQAEAIVADDGRITAIGSNEEILLDFARADVRKVDLMGGYAYPGLVDSHMHLSNLGQKLRQLDLTHCQSKEEMLFAIRQRAETIKPGEWILGMGWDENKIQGRVPSLAELDAVASNHPVFLSRICFHAYLVNSRAYQLAGVGPDQPDPENGAYGRDETGKLNGWVYENAANPFYDAQPEPDYAEKKESIRQAMKMALSCGLTGVHTEDLRYIGSVRDMIRICRELIEEGVLLRTHQLIYYPFLTELDELKIRAGQGDEWFRIGALKMFADGAIGGRTALLSEPYADDPGNCGIAIHEQAELLYLTAQAADRGMPVAVHAIGDEAADRVIQAMQAYPIDPDKGSRLRHRLIHGQFLRADLVEMLRRMEVAIDIQPRFVASDFPWVLERVGEERTAYAYAWKALLQAGIRCAGGSDAPIEPLHPLLGIHAAVTRRRPDDPPSHPGYLPGQKLAPLEALLLFTEGSAYAAGEEHERGTLSVGKYADLSVYDRDLLTIDPDELLQAQTMFTIVSGKVAYQA
ncbi:amidohydrolase [Paenactinomyces guangxiensis]|uniref:Amidohydrolase n=1 Tax=Paenactinomyces guangxiensis TaxID=1490290 RepID=A0A7W1WMT2_9BACL|nr:amidohydrolase [Paenactinomyces guangxiensis]MBA4492774.1 amidohydrolase [Paenactinomyces guangxiensis]MBH8590377.1 amidohydrolase [Paenactinomyces guangxiensis]